MTWRAMYARPHLSALHLARRMLTPGAVRQRELVGGRVLHPSTYLLDLSTFCGLRWVVALTYWLRLS
jgi:hypothetical protein